MKYLRIVLLLVMLVAWASAQAQVVRLKTPRETLETHLRYLRADYQLRSGARSYTAAAAQTLHNPELRGQFNDKELRRRAVMLKEIYEGLGEYVDFDQVADDPDYRDSLALKPNSYFVASHFGYDITLEKVRGNWYYSAQTIENIPRLHRLVFPVDFQELMGLDLFDPPQTFLGITLWQYVGLLVLALALLLVYRLLRWLLVRLPGALLKRRGHEAFATDYLPLLAYSLAAFGALALARFWLPSLQMGIDITRYLYPLVYVLMVLQLGRFAYHFVNVMGYATERVVARRQLPLDTQLLVLVKRMVRVLVVTVAAAYLLQYIGLNVTSVVAGLSIGGLAVALAAQDTLKNVFGSFMIFMDKPFKVGDWIIGDKIDGEVERVGFRSTRIRTFYNSITTIPNGRLADMTLDNMGLRPEHRYRTKLGLTLDTPTELLQTFVDGLRQMAQNHKQINPDRVVIVVFDFTPSAIEVLFQVHILVSEFEEEVVVREELILRILQLAETLGVRLAYPTTTLHVESLPGSLPLTPSHNRQPDELRQQVEKFLAALPNRRSEG